ncbi:cobalamin-binding protein, partial [Candidatus Aerophobetes bacterium]|nr:cobalamin-binding protein [Candidatus Aerophobetes bacterium]
MVDLKEIAENLIRGNAPAVKELVKKAIDEG